MCFRITVHYPATGHYFNYIAIMIGPRHVYNVKYEGAKNKIVVQKKGGPW